MTDLLARLRELEAAATKGPWRQMDQWIDASSRPPPIASSHQDYATAPGGTLHAEALANAALIVAMRNALPDLLARIEALEREIEGLRALLRDGQYHLRADEWAKQWHDRVEAALTAPSMKENEDAR